MADAPELIPGLLAVGVIAVWSLAQAGAFPTSSNPGGLFILGLLVAVTIAFRRSLRALPRPMLLAIAFAGAFTVWSFASIGWADVKGDAGDGANRALVYFTVFALFALPPWRPRAAATVPGTFSLVIAGIAAVTFLRASGSAHPELFFIGGSFAEPTGYHNADSALFLLGFFPALFLASRRETPWPLRGLMLAAAGLLLELALLPQSRGALIVFPIAAALYLALVPGRARTLIAAVPLAVAMALTAGPILDVFSAASGGDLGAALDSARLAIGISFVALLGVGLALALVDRQVSISARATRLANRWLGALGVVAAVVGAIVLIAVIGNPFSWASARWDDFTKGYPAEGFGSSRLGGSLGSNRYDFWRVSADELSGSPLTGVGADNFAVDYLRQRHSTEEPSDPHSLPLAIGAQTGLVGGALFVGFVASALFSAARVRWRDGTPLGAGLAAVSVVTFAYWLMHSSGDWFWTLPALSAPALAFLALAGRIDAPRPSRGSPAPGRSSSPSSRRTLVAATAFAGVIVSRVRDRFLHAALGGGAQRGAGCEQLGRQPAPGLRAPRQGAQLEHPERPARPGGRGDRRAARRQGPNAHVVQPSARARFQRLVCVARAGRPGRARGQPPCVSREASRGSPPQSGRSPDPHRAAPRRAWRRGSVAEHRPAAARPGLWALGSHPRHALLRG